MRTILALAALHVLATTAAAAICTANAHAPVACDLRPPTRLQYRIVRDAYDVPHVKAKTRYDVGYAMGVAQAQDRLFQMEVVRKSATGNIAEVFGASFVDDDIDTRRQFYSEEERAYLVSTLDCDVQVLVEGFVDGINATVDALYADPSLAKLPHEFFFLPTVVRLQGNGTIPSGVRYSVVTIGGQEVYKPDSWRATDVAAVATLLAGRFGSGGGRQLRQAALLDYLTHWFGEHGAPNGQSAADAARDVFEDVRWLNDPKAPTTIPSSGAINPVVHGTTPVALADADPAPSAPLLLAERLRRLLTPATASAAPSRGGAQEALVRSLAPSTITAGLRAADRLEAHAKRLNKLFGVFRKSGSNAWVVTPSRSENHHALLWGGPQEGFDNPNIDVEMYVRSRRMTAGGMMIAGVPGVLIGMTRTFGYTTTSGEIDNSTLYVETLQSPADPEPQTASASYNVLFDGQYVPMDRRTEVFHFAGEDTAAPPAYAPGGAQNDLPPVSYNVFRVHDCDPDHFHGYVLAFDLSAVPPRAFTYKTAYWKDETSTVEGFLDMSEARGFDDFRAGADRVVSLHNFFYADRYGNIAYFSSGARPAFPVGFDDRLPADGTGSQEWGLHPDGSRYVPFSRSLLSVNPTQGWLTNWNTKPADKPYIQEGNSHDEHWGEIYRSQRMAFLLEHNDHMSLHDMQEIERDVGSMDGSTDTVRAAAPYLMPYIAQAYANLQAANDPLVDPTAHPTLAAAMDVLTDWNAYLADTSAIYPGGGHYAASYEPSHGQSGMSLFYQWWYALKSNLWGGAGAPYSGTVSFSELGIDGNDYLDETTYNMFLHLMEPDPGVPQHFTGDYFGGHRDQLVMQSLNDAIAILAGTGAQPRRGYGTCSGDHVDTPGFGDPDPHHWPWTPEPDLDFDCLDSFADHLLSFGTQPTSFGTAPSENRSTYMQAIDAAPRPFGANVLPPGQSGYIRHVGTFNGVADPHMGDQAPLFRTFTYKPMTPP